MKLPQPGTRYDPGNEAQMRSAVEREDLRNQKKGADVDVGSASLILTAPDGGRWAVVVDNTGALSTTAA